MIHVKLETADGQHAADQAVLPFLEAPKVLIWGDRVFSHVEQFKDEFGLPADRYREVFFYTVTGSEKYTLGDLMSQRGMPRPGWTLRSDSGGA